MTRLVSIGTMLEQLDGLRDTRDISDWEDGFITSVLEKYLLAGKRTSGLTERQVEKIEQLYANHFET
jgi:hypothetical protein